jgi:hypothetical protein
MSARKVSLRYCTPTTAAGLRAWMRVLPQLTSVQWIEVESDASVFVCDPGFLKQANIEASNTCSVLAMWGEHTTASTLPSLRLPVTPESFTSFVHQVEMQLARRRRWWQTLGRNDSASPVTDTLDRRSAA